MKYIPLDNIQNQYPLNSSVKTKYTGNDVVINYFGKFNQNQIEFPRILFNEVLVAEFEEGELNAEENIDYMFVIRFKIGELYEYYTSTNFLNQLLKSKLDNNPYFNLNTVTVVDIDYDEIIKFSKSDELVISELYAEVAVTETIDTKKEIIRHINWLVTIDAVDSQLRNVDEFGSWKTDTSSVDQLGIQYLEQIENMNNSST